MKLEGAYWFTPTHEWVYVEEGSSVVKVGLSSVGVQLLGGVVRVELPPVGRAVAAGEELLLLETDKTAMGVASPLAGRVTRVNGAIQGSPSLLEEQPYTGGWLVEIQAENLTEQLRGLIPQERYFEQMNLPTTEE